MYKGLTFNVLARAALGKAKFTAGNFFIRRRHYCRALAGESDYNICINSDMSVSCNCQDFDGSGQIGNLRTHTLAEIFSGETVRSFQTQLYSKKYPATACRGCSELALIPTEKIAAGPVPGAVPSAGIMLENTLRCNLNCEICRNQKVHHVRKQNFLSIEDVTQASEEIASHGIKQICYFGLGEPFLSPSILEELTIVRAKNPEARIVISTNGTLIDTPEKVEAALITDYLYFSIDGVSQETLEQYQRGGNFEQAYNNMKAVAAARNSAYEHAELQTAANPSQAAHAKRTPEIEWKYLMFRWNDSPEHIDQAVELAREAGIDRIVFHVGMAKLEDRSRRFSESRYSKTAVRREGSGFSIEF